jgi:hypothetical protein
LIIDHVKVHQQIFINNSNNKGKCVRIQIQKLKFAIIVKTVSFPFFFVLSLYFFFSLVYTHQNNTTYHDFLLLLSLSAFIFLFHMIYFSFFLSFVSRFVSVTATCAFFYDMHSTLPNFFNIYIYLQLFFIYKKKE